MTAPPLRNGDYSAPDVLPGQCYHLGATVQPEGVNFCIFSKNCTALELLLFDRADDPKPARVIPLDPNRNRTFYYWHVLVTGIGPGQLYGYRVHGPHEPAHGLLYDGAKVLLDPYTRAVMYGDNFDAAAACRPGDNCAQSLKGVVTDLRAYDWEGDAPLRLPFEGMAIYEMHVGGFTRHPNAGIERSRRGTYAGLIDKISYLQDLGITSVELLPVHQFTEPTVALPLKNYWGYNTIAFFAPHRGYSSDQGPLGPLNEFRDMVKALHRAGIEVILDVVFNHTAEGDRAGPTLSFRGLENRAYYILDPKGEYANYTGCGNTLNGNQSIVRRLIVDCLRYWVQDMHVDGFRFDLASVLSRDEGGLPLKSPPILWDIESDPILAGTKIIAEAWDAAGLYQVGSFIGHRWAEWNGQFRDDVRRFVKGERGTVRRLALRIAGSPDLYPQVDRDPHRSINFVTCHDGFTLNDLVSFDHKHNEANGEQNRDGADANFSWNCGHEGPTDDPLVNELRCRQMKNLLAILLISQGTPMLLMGDEIQRTQAGNNNAYCQDNETSWFDWEAVRGHASMRRFTRGLLQFKRRFDLFQKSSFWSVVADDRAPIVTWHGVRLFRPDWAEDSHSLAFSVRDPENGEHLHVMLNAYWEALPFALPALSRGERWHRVVDTALPSPDDMADPGAEVTIIGSEYCVTARSVVILMVAHSDKHDSV